MKWSEFESVTMDIRVNVLNIGMSAEGYFGDRANVKAREGASEAKEEKEMSAGQKAEEEVQRKERALLRRWLSEEVRLGGFGYFELFVTNEIHSLDDVREFIEEKAHLVEIGIKPFAHRARLWKAIVALK